jgi:hypothetical protein
MFNLYERHRKEQDFEQEYAYVEDYSLYHKPSNGNQEEDESPRGVVEIDLNNGKTIQIS